jgi:hypothetical protein
MAATNTDRRHVRVRPPQLAERSWAAGSLCTAYPSGPEGRTLFRYVRAARANPSRPRLAFIHLVPEQIPDFRVMCFGA